MNAPEAGTIKELLVNEEDTVVVGQDLLKIELGGAPEGAKPAEAAKEEPKAPADKSQEPGTKAAPPKEQREESKPQPRQEAPAKKEQPAPPKPKTEGTAGGAPSSTEGLGHREERRVSDDMI